MAEALIQTRTYGPDPAPQDGDPIIVVGPTEIRSQAFRAICDVWQCPQDQRTTNGQIRTSSPCYRYQVETREARIEVVAPDERRIVDQRTGRSRRESGLRVAALIRQTVARRLARGTLFGDTLGQAIWFAGGYREPDDAAALRIWMAIETQTPERRANWRRWRWGIEERRVHLVLPVADMTAARLRAVQAAETRIAGVDADGTDIVERVRFRRHRVPWETLGLPQTPERVRDPAIVSDMRDLMAEVAEAAFQSKPSG